MNRKVTRLVQKKKADYNNVINSCLRALDQKTQQIYNLLFGKLNGSGCHSGRLRELVGTNAGRFSQPRANSLRFGV